jgi:hypothetical protein
MAGRIAYYGNTVTNGLVLSLDAAKRDSYPGSGTAWRDISGNGNNGTFSGSFNPIYSIDTGGKFFFYTGSSYINFNSSAIKTYFNGLTNATLEAWMNISSSATGWIIGFNPTDNQSGNRFSIVSQGTFLYFQIENSAIPASYSSCSLNANNQWVHAVLSYNGALIGLSKISAYINGVQQTLAIGGSAPPSSLSTTLSDFNIGTLSVGKDCNIGKVMAYNRTLSTSEVLQNYNAIKSRYGL